MGTTERHEVRFRLLIGVQIAPEVLVDDGRWREDFYYRTSGVVLKVPPLRERASDIPLLINLFLRTHGRAPVDPAALSPLALLEWPGNVRQLRRAVERVIFEADSAPPSGERLVAAATEAHRRGGCRLSGEQALPTREEAEERHIRDVLLQCGHSAKRTAAVLDISVSQLYRLMERYEIAHARRRAAEGRGP